MARSGLAMGMLVAMLGAVLALGFYVQQGMGRAKETIAHDPNPLVFSFGQDFSPNGSVTGVIALDAYLDDGELKVQGSTPRLFIGRRFYNIRSGEEYPDLDELNRMGIPISEDNPFILADLVVRPWSSEWLSVPSGGSVIIDSVQRVWDLNLSEVVQRLVQDFSELEAEHRPEVGLAMRVLDPAKYNVLKTAIRATFSDGHPLVVFDQAAQYGGPLEWYIEPVHLLLTAFQLDEDGKTEEVIVVPPHLGSRVSGNLRLLLFMTSGQIRAGDEIRFMLALENQGKEAYEVQAGLPLFDLKLYDSANRAMGSWSSGKAFAEYVESLKLEAGEFRRESLSWDLSIYNDKTGLSSYPATGAYRVCGLWLPDGIETTRLDMKVDSSRPELNLTWIRTGGIAGLNERFRLTLGGKATLENLRTGKALSLSLTPSQHWALYDSLREHGLGQIMPEEFKARGGTADFFVYDMAAFLDGVEKKLKWVDLWAVQEPYPVSLVGIDNTVARLVERVRNAGSPA